MNEENPEEKILQNNTRGGTLLAWFAPHRAELMAAAAPAWCAFQRGRFLV
jgi:hypothetical protein